jgi:polygalacturonase
VIGDGIHDDTRAMQALVSQPHSIVVIPVHTTVKTGPLTLTSHLTLQVDGTLQALDATPSVLNTTTTTWPILPPLDLYNSSEDLGKTRQYQALLYAQNVTRVRITGTGIIDGRGELWWNAFRAKFSLLQAGRPNLVQMVHSRRVEIDSVTFRNSPFWTIHPVHCEFVYIHHVTIRARLYAPNVDGIDPDACRHVLMEYNDISCGDDHIAIKAGRCGEDGVTPNKCTNPIWSSGVYQTTNVTVRHNIFRVGMGIAIGSESSGSIRNIEIYNNTVGLCPFGHITQKSCGWGPALHIKTTLTRGGTIENVIFRDNIVYNTSCFILLEMGYQNGEKVDPPKDYAATVVRNISFVRNRAMGMATGASFECFRKDACEEITVINNTVEHVAEGSPSPWACRYVKSYRVAGNFPPGLEECMANSMNETIQLPLAVQ